MVPAADPTAAENAELKRANAILTGQCAGRCSAPTIADHAARLPEDLVQRRLAPAAPDRLWVADNHLCVDNALAETINGLYKTELIKKHGPWRSVDHVEIATAEWVDWFNHRRLYEYCGDLPPAEMEAAHYAQIRAQQPAELSNR